MSSDQSQPTKGDVLAAGVYAGGLRSSQDRPEVVEVFGETKQKLVERARGTDGFSDLKNKLYKSRSFPADAVDARAYLVRGPNDMFHAVEFLDFDTPGGQDVEMTVYLPHDDGSGGGVQASGGSGGGTEPVAMGSHTVYTDAGANAAAGADDGPTFEEMRTVNVMPDGTVEETTYSGKQLQQAENSLFDDDADLSDLGIDAPEFGIGSCDICKTLVGRICEYGCSRGAGFLCRFAPVYGKPICYPLVKIICKTVIGKTGCDEGAKAICSSAGAC